MSRGVLNKRFRVNQHRTSEIKNASEPLQNSPPRVYEYHARDDWLSAWVDYQLTALKKEGGEPYSLQAGEALPLLLSIGFESALTADGKVWVWNAGIEFEPGRESEFKLATEGMRLSILATMQKTLFPEFSTLLPSKPPNAVPCDQCEGLIATHLFICTRCNCMGWVLP